MLRKINAVEIKTVMKAVISRESVNVNTKMIKKLKIKMYKNRNQV